MKEGEKGNTNKDLVSATVSASSVKTLISNNISINISSPESDGLGVPEFSQSAMP